VLSRIPPPRLGVTIERELYLSEPPTYVERLQTLPDTALSVLVIGHNPTLSQLAERWLGRRVALHPAAWVLATFSLPSWQDLR
jgi:phosphohistidine phosphatase SixA